MLNKWILLKFFVIKEKLIYVTFDLLVNLYKLIPDFYRLLSVYLWYHRKDYGLENSIFFL